MSECESAVALYTFLREFAQLRTRKISDFSAYEQVIWAADVPREHGCDCIAWHRDADGASDEVWLEMRKPHLPPPPAPPAAVSAWVRHEQLASSLDIPELYPTLLGESAEDPPLRLEDYPEVQAAWDAYVEDYWWAWAERDRREQVIQEIYTDLFSMYQRQQRLGETFDIVFGLGLLSWNPPDGPEVRRHLTVARVSVEFNPVSGTLRVIPAGEGARPSLEQDMLDPQYRPDPQVLRAMEETLEQIGESVWATGPVDGLLKSWVHSVSAEGEYSAALDRPERSGTTPVVHLAPALILRPRTERSFIRAFDDIIEQLEVGEPVPEGVSRFISVSEEQARGDGASGRPPEEIFFPLPANDAQRQIIERLTANQGVLVQGPPGTGKSHTIVNLICHALASGQRVLVTSHTVRALKVLQGMIRDRAPDLAPLSVVLLGDDREALHAMEESVQGITTRQNTWDPETSRETIAGLEIDLDRRRRRQTELLVDLRAIRERETIRHDAKFGYNGTLPRIADTLHRERESLAWIPDQSLEESEPPLDAIEFGEILSLLRDARVSHWEAAGTVSIHVESLPTAEGFEQAVLAERETRTTYERDAPIRQWPEYSALARLTEDNRLNLEKRLAQLFQLVERSDRWPLPWAGTATKQVLGGFERTWRQLHVATTEAVKWTAEQAPWLDRNPVSLESGSDLRKIRTEANDLLAHLEAGGGWGIGPFRAAAVKRALPIRELWIGGRLCDTVDTVRDLVKWLDAEIGFCQLRERWAPYHQITATTFADRVAELEDLCKPLENAFAAQSTAKGLSAILGSTPASPEPDWSDRGSLNRLNEAFAVLKATHQYEAAREQIENVSKELGAQSRRGQLDPVSEELKTAVMERNTSSYTTARQRAAENLELAARLDRKGKLFHRLKAGAPELAKGLAAAPSDTVWEGRAADFERAWNWSRAHAWVTRLAAVDSEQQHRLELDHTKQEIAHTLGRLAAEKAWAHCFNRMTENERQHLVAWSKAVRAIGKGTGKYAPMHRRNAREHLNESRSAIPAWVMPLHRVAETIKPGSELFDIAIIDEASQSGPEVLLLAYLATKLVVVGDDKQIHPTYAGVNFEDVNQLRERYIAGLPHADAYGVNQSFFDLAEIRYKGRIRLREHFRCMPEIIQFSNNLSYRGEPLIPLRQYGAGRLEPVVTTRHVPDGYLKGTGAARSVNTPEVAAIVAEIAKIHDDPAYEGKTIGVISLVGDAQAREIERSLVRELEPEEMERRKLVCGDAYAFQGDERDVMFLSMVSAPSGERSIPAMTDESSQRRFNVAASRARDQLYLFHTATLADLNPRCVRYQLLKYCLDPNVAMADAPDLDVPKLERIALKANRQLGNQPEPFDSWFELDVFLPIARRGYRVIPQFKVGGYRIDLVVQGMKGSLAVECDGDAWHGPDRYEEDIARQRDLERCGWEFCQVRESVFRLDPDKALEDLWEKLERRGVFPKVEDDIRRTAATRGAQMSSTARGSGDGFAVDNDRITLGTTERNAPSEIRLGEGTAVTAAAEQPSAAAPTQGRANEDGDEPDLEVRSEYPNSKTRDSRPKEERPENVPHLASVLSASSLSQPTPPSHHGEPTRTGPARGDWLAPYTEWTPADTVPDPRNASQAELVGLLTNVVEQEGPVVAIRVYRLINRASGSRRLTAPVRRTLNRVSTAAIRAGVVAVTNPLDRQGQDKLVFRRPGTPGVDVRERGPRDLDELPPDEVAMMLSSLRERDPGLDQEQLKRQLLSALRWVRLTDKVSEFLDGCITLM